MDKYKYELVYSFICVPIDDQLVDTYILESRDSVVYLDQRIDALKHDQPVELPFLSERVLFIHIRKEYTSLVHTSLTQAENSDGS